MQSGYVIKLCVKEFLYLKKIRRRRGIFVAFIVGMYRPVGLSYQESLQFLLKPPKEQ